MFTRKLGFGKSSHSSGPANRDEDGEPSETSETPFGRHDHRSASEPTDQLLSSIPSHLRDATTPRLSSASGASFPDVNSTLSPTETYGLSLVHDTTDSDVDFIFVHGLGGSSRRSWSWNRDPDYFWPMWLPMDRELSNSRIFTFGYNANMRGPSSNLNILEFAKDLLLRMLTFSGGGEPMPAIGVHPIIFVAHSMGGLVVKKAYVLAKNDKKYTRILSKIHGMVFLSTPHKGSNYAHILNNILSAAPLGSQKLYISELANNSSSLQDINEQFRIMCGDLILASFYESLKTSLGPGVKRQIVESDSGVLGYPQETSSSLNADHHSICKYKTPEDPNYVDVKNMLKWMVSSLPVKEFTHKRPGTVTNLQRLEEILGISDVPDQDLHLHRGSAMDGSCQWITKRQSFRDWIYRSEVAADIYWLTGAPATGKSTLAGFVIDYLRHGFPEKSCQYHFFLSGHETKQSITYCLRSIAFQLASSSEAFRSALFALHEETGVQFGSTKLHLIWEQIFEGMIFKTAFSGPLFWVVDALDEAETPALLVNLFTKFRSITPIKIFTLSRITRELAPLANHTAVTHQPLSITDTLQDIRAYVNNVVHSALPYDSDFQEDIVNQVLTKSSGSFLWVRLALDALKDNWHTEDDVRKALDDVPAGMESLYDKMIADVDYQPPRPRDMARSILTWTACSSRPLQLVELEVALESKFKRFVSLEDTIVQICGQFVRVDNSRINLIHSTARQFLIDRTDENSWINRREAHELIALRCLEFLSDDRWRRVFTRTADTALDSGRMKRNRLAPFELEHPFLSYAMANWSFHVSNASLDSELLLPALSNFLQLYCLSWIHAVALSGDLRSITRAAENLKAYVKKRGRRNLSSAKNLRDGDTNFLRLWAVDLIRIVGKFGGNLAESPPSIYRIIPPFCPGGSIICQTYSQVRDNTLSVSGISSFDWDDCLARLNVGGDETASKVLCTGSYFVTLIGSSGTLIVWYAETCDEARRMKHREWVTMMASNKSGTMLVTAGVETFRVWELATGREIYCLPKRSQARTMAIAFGTVDAELLIGRDDFSVSCFDLPSLEERWSFLAEEPWDTDHSCPRLMSFSQDVTKVAIACRGKPVLVWDMSLKAAQHPRKCIRTVDRGKDEGDVWNAPEIVKWQPEGTSLLILYQDATVVDWRIVEDEQDEYGHLGAREMTISQDGNLLLTSDHNGTLSIWTFPRLNLLYRLYYDEFVRDLAFSPSGHRFYDTRGSLCNVWEPDALIRSEDHEREDTSSISESSIISEPVYSHDDNSRSQITALACDSEDKYYCCGKDDGTVSIHSMAEGKRIRKVYSHSLTVSIIALAWSLSGKYIVSGDDSGRVIAKRLESKEPGKWAVFAIFDHRLNEPVEQFLYHPAERLLLISTRSGDRIWDLKAKEEVCSRRWPSQTGRRWISHPLQENILLWIDPDEVLKFNWENLESTDRGEQSPKEQRPSSKGKETASSPPKRPPLPHPSSRPTETAESVQWISRTKNRRYIICETLPDTGHGRAASTRGMRLDLLPTSKIGNTEPERITRESLVQLANRVARLIGSYQDRVAFLDHQYWLCTWEIDTDFSTVKRHFFLPRDWLSPSTLQLAILNLHGTFLCPKNGEVGIVRNGVKL